MCNSDTNPYLINDNSTIHDCSQDSIGHWKMIENGFSNKYMYLSWLSGHKKRSFWNWDELSSSVWTGVFSKAWYHKQHECDSLSTDLNPHFHKQNSN